LMSPFVPSGWYEAWKRYLGIEYLRFASDGC
jgi:hypothetical protein